MSEQEKDKNKQQQQNTDSSTKREELLVKVDRSSVEKDLADELQKKEVEKKTIELEKTKLNDALLEAQKKAKEMEERDQAKSKEYEDILKERDETRAKLQEIAMAKFNEVKTARLTSLKTAGLPDDKIKEFDEKIKTPKDLDEMDFVLKIIGEQFVKAQEERDKDAKTGDQKPPKSNPENPPAGSKVRLPEPAPRKGKIYQNPREAVEALYKGEAEGDKEAASDLNKLWEKFIPTIKNKMTTFGISECPNCGAGIQQGEKCWYCGFDPVKWRASGGEIF
jgi:hypothetical protein